MLLIHGGRTLFIRCTGYPKFMVCLEESNSNNVSNDVGLLPMRTNFWSIPNYYLSKYSLVVWVKSSLIFYFFHDGRIFQNNMVIIYDHGICIYPFGFYHSKIMPTHLNQYVHRGLEVNILVQRRVICILRNIIKHSKDLQSNKV